MQCPTTIVPFFGDQFFWAERIHAKGVGPAPIPISELNVERLSSAIKFMLDPEVTGILDSIFMHMTYQHVRSFSVARHQIQP